MRGKSAVYPYLLLVHCCRRSIAFSYVSPVHQPLHYSTLLMSIKNVKKKEVSFFTLIWDLPPAPLYRVYAKTVQTKPKCMTLAHWPLRLSAKSPHPPFAKGGRAQRGGVCSNSSGGRILWSRSAPCGLRCSFGKA